MELNTNLTFNGQCEAAFKFYAQCLGGKIQTMMTWGDSPMGDQVPVELRDRIIHATLIVGESALGGGDAPPDRYEEPKGIWVTIQIDDPSEAERIFGALSADGTVTMPIQQTFWAERFGMCVDRFGTPWMVNCGQSSKA